jgi:hypothetical protein
MDNLSRLQLDDEKRKKRTEEEISDLEEITLSVDIYTDFSEE